MALKPKSDDIKSVEVAGVGRVGAGGAGVGLPSTDRLSLDLQFATDKTLTARKGPTPVFTRASTATFVGSNGLIQSAAINAARFDHDPITLACRGLLIEESRTNLIRQSEDINTTWVKERSTVSTNAIASPDGNTTADLMVETVSLGLHDVYQDVSVVNGTSYTASIYAKSKERSEFKLIFDTTGSTNGVFFNLSTGTVGTANTGWTGTISALPNGWYRCSVTRTVITTGTIFLLPTISSGSETISYLGDSTKGMYFWGVQVEVGSFPTSYIPTTTASVVRSADLCSITGSDFTGFYNQSEGTIVGSGLTNQLTSNAGPELFRSSDGTNNNRIQFGMTNFPTQAVRPFIVASGTATYTSTQGTATVGVERKVGMAYKTNDTISAFNGTLGTLDTTVTPPTNCNQVSLFAGLGGGTISSLRYYKKRLANAKLQTLTT